MDDIWFLIYAPGDNSYSIIPDCSVLNAKNVTVGDKVTFFYSNKGHIGTVKMMGDREKLNDELKTVKSDIKRVVKAKEPVVSGKRESKRPKRFAFEDTAENSVPTKKKKKKDSVSEAKLKAGASEMNKALLASTETKATFEVSSDDNASDPEVGDKAVAKKKILKSRLLRNIKSPLSDSEDDQQCSSDASLKSSLNDCASIQDLEKLLQDAKAKLEELRGKETNSKQGNDSTSEVSFNADGPEDESDFPEGQQAQPTLEEEEKQAQGDSAISSPKQSPTILNAKKEKAENCSDNSGMASISKVDPRVSQMYGKDYEEEEMFELGDGIYCKMSVLEEAQRKSVNAHHMVRRLLLGVFKEEAVVENTLTGQLPRAAGKEKYVKGQKMKGLYPKGIETITNYARNLCKGMKWDKPTTQCLRDTITQRIGEVKRNFAKKAAQLESANNDGSA